mmetsp:Transcript_33263/g.43849  ORF Transcript_33263/g.43849 Transcript_33263/m.43849 type:complete len:112 (+) Transcript_33263:76-411(+)
MVLHLHQSFERKFCLPHQQADISVNIVTSSVSFIEKTFAKFLFPFFRIKQQAFAIFIEIFAWIGIMFIAIYKISFCQILQLMQVSLNLGWPNVFNPAIKRIICNIVKAHVH